MSSIAVRRIPCRGPVRTLLRWSTAASLLFLSGCGSLLIALSNDVSNVHVPDSWSNGRPDSSATSLAHWWQRFDDPQIGELVKQALLANIDVRTARAALQQSRAQRDVTAASLFPSGNASASAQRAKSCGVPPTDTFQTLLAASWTPDIFGGARAGVAAADAAIGAAGGSLGNIELSAAADVGNTYLLRCTPDPRLDIARDNLASQEETLQIAGWRAQAGLTTSLDAGQVRILTEQTRAQVPLLEASLAQARSHLAVLTGMTLEAMQASWWPPAVIPSVTDDLALAFPARPGAPCPGCLRSRKATWRQSRRKLPASRLSPLSFARVSLSSRMGATGPPL